MNLREKVAVITGSSRGIGRATALAMARADAKVVVSSRKERPCLSVVEEIRENGGEAIAIPCNISREEDLDTLVTGAVEAFGRIDALVCNAAVNPYFGPTSSISRDAYQKIMDANLWASLRLAALVAPDMASRRNGAIIFISSAATQFGSHSIGTYAMSKAAEGQLARNLAVEWGHANVRVNCIAPGLIRTDMARAIWEDPRNLEQVTKIFPLGRLGEPEDVANVVAFLASDAAGFITGQTLTVDGGMTIADRV